MLVRKHIVQFNISTYVQTGAWGAKVGIHPGRKMPAMTLHTKFVMVTWCQGALLNHLKLLQYRKILTCCAMARADGGLRGEQSFTVTCAGGERVSTLCTQKLVPVKCKTSSRHFVDYFQGWKKKFIYTHENPLYVEDWIKFVFADHCREVHLLHSCFVSSGPQSLAARKSSWCGFNNWGWSQIVQQH